MKPKPIEDRYWQSYEDWLVHNGLERSQRTRDLFMAACDEQGIPND